MKEEIETRNVAEMARSENRQVVEEIKVTPEMIEAGVDRFMSHDPEKYIPAELRTAIEDAFKAMHALRPQSDS